MVSRIEPIKGLRGASEYNKRDYFSDKIVKPRRDSKRDAATGQDPLELRAAQAVSGSVLERIMYKRMDTLFGPEGIQWVYKYQAGTGGVRNARVFVGGIEMDFVFLSHPSKQEMDIEVQGANWHRDIEGYGDMERALEILKSGRLYEEIWEFEIMLGDEYLDQRILAITQYTGKLPERRETGFPEIRTFTPDRRERTRSAA